MSIKYSNFQAPNGKFYEQNDIDYLMNNGNEAIATHHLADYCKQKLDQSGEYVRINGRFVLDEKGNKEKGRKKTSNKWFETQDSISYWEEFSKPKIIYNDIAQTLSFALSKKGEFLNNTAYFFGSHNIELLKFLLTVLNSNVIDWYYRTISVQLGEKAVRMFSIYVLKIPIPQRISVLDNEEAVYNLYYLSDEEIAFLKARII